MVKNQFSFSGLLIYYLLSVFCHTLYDKMHTLMSFMTIYGK